MSDVLEWVRAADPAAALDGLLGDGRLEVWREAGLREVLAGQRAGWRLGGVGGAAVSDVLEWVRAADPAAGLDGLLGEGRLEAWSEAGPREVLAGRAGPVDVLARPDDEPRAAADRPGQRSAAQPSDGRSAVTPLVSRRRWRAARRWLVPAAGVAAAVVLAVTIGLPGRTTPALAATPPVLRYGQVAATSMSEAQALAHQCLNRQRSERAAPAAFTLRWTEWSLNTRVDGQVVTSAVVPVQVSLSRRSDGSARLVRRTAPPQFPDRQSRERWEEAGRPAARPVTVAQQQWAPGGFDQASAYLPDDPGRLLPVLSRSHPIDQLGDAEVLVAIADTYRSAALSPAQQAALFVLAASRPGLQAFGHATDRAGRPGYALSVESDYSGLPTRYTAIFDPVTGRLLDLEQTLTRSAGRLNVRVPSTIGYTLFD